MTLLEFAKKVAATESLPPEIRREASALVAKEREAATRRVANSRAKAREREANRGA